MDEMDDRNDAAPVGCEHPEEAWQRYKFSLTGDFKVVCRNCGATGTGDGDGAMKWGPAYRTPASGCEHRGPLEQLLRRFIEYRQMLMDDYDHALSDYATGPVTSWEADLAEMLYGDPSAMPPAQPRTPAAVRSAAQALRDALEQILKVDWGMDNDLPVMDEINGIARAALAAAREKNDDSRS